MRYLIISDIHTHHDTAQRIIDSVPHDVVVCLGDFFDDFGDTARNNEDTAIWLKDKLAQANFVACWGNHDISYWCPNRATWCSGFGDGKQAAVSSVLGPADWAKFRPFYYIQEGNWLLSHAGVNRYAFGNPACPLNVEDIGQACKEGLYATSLGQYHPVFQAGWDRGGVNRYGGITWQSFETLIPLDEFRQVVGHTPSWPQPQVRFFGKGGNIRQQSVGNFHGWGNHPEIVVDIDTHNRHYAVIEDGKISIHSFNIDLHEQKQTGED